MSEPRKVHPATVLLVWKTFIGLICGVIVVFLSFYLGLIWWATLIIGAVVASIVFVYLFVHDTKYLQNNKTENKEQKK